MMDGSTETLTRRGLLRGQFTSRKKDAGPGWCAVEGIDTRPGDVFWCGWADEAGVLVAGDDGVILQFDGESWIRETAPVPVPVHALWGRHRGDLWAVGWMGMILHHDGEGWTRIRGCVVDEQGKYASIPENTPLFDIAGREDGHAWAVGDRGTILHYDGQGWSAETSGTRAHLRSVIALADGRVMASGGNGTVLIRSPQGEWTPLSCPVGSNFTASAQLEDGLVLLAGGRYFVDPGGFRGDLVLFDGESFVKLFEGMEFSRFRAVGTVREGIITLGDAGQVHLIRNKRIDRVASGTAHDLLGLVKVPGGEALVVGDFGVVLAGDSTALASFAPPVQRDAEAANWSRMDSGTDRQLWGLWHDREADRLYACGEEGTVLCLDRGKWERLPPVGELGIHDLARAPDGGLLAVGQLGEIHHFDGHGWTRQFDLHMDITLLSIWSDGAGSLFAAGDEGLVLTWNGSGWERMPSGTKSALYGLWGVDAQHLLAVGDFGLVLRWNGQRWDEFNAGTEHFLFDAWGRGLDDIYIVGLSGTIGHFDGQRWRITPAPGTQGPAGRDRNRQRGGRRRCRRRRRAARRPALGDGPDRHLCRASGGGGGRLRPLLRRRGRGTILCRTGA